METAQKTATQTYQIDPTHSRMGFAARHMGFAKVRGSFEEFEGTIQMDPDDLESIEADVTINTDTINTGVEKRDGHLRSGDFFGVEEHPEIRFKSTRVTSVDGNTFTLVGNLTIRDETKEVTLEGEFLGEGQDPWGGTRVAFEGTTTVDRTEFGLTWNQALEAGGVLVGENIDLILEVQAVLQE